MNTRFLEAFIWVVRLGSFRAAAERLNMTQAAISSRIAALEQDVSLRLFDRETREVRLTSAGRLFLDHAEAILSAERRMRSAVSETGIVAGRVRLGIVETVLHTWLIDFLQTVHAAHPGLEIELTSEPTHRLHEQLRRGTLDVILQTDPVLGESIRNRDLGSMIMGWVGPPTTAQDGSCALEQIMAGDVITMTRGSQPHTALLLTCERTGLDPKMIHCVSSMDAIVRLVEAGLGFALVPRAAVREQIASGRLREPRTSAPLPPLRLVASFTDDPSSDAATRIVDLAWTQATRYAATMGVEFAAPAAT